MLMYCIVSCDIVLRRKCIEQFLLIWAQIRSLDYTFALSNFFSLMYFFLLSFFVYLLVLTRLEKQSIIVQILMSKASAVRVTQNHIFRHESASKAKDYFCRPF